MGRKLTLSIFRYNPNQADSKPFMQDFQIEETEGMTLFVALNEIREKQDPSLKFDFVCRAAICGSCAMLVNGKPGLACKTRTATLGKKIILQPLPVFKMLGDLSVDTGTWFRGMYEKTGSWIHSTKEFDPKAIEEKMTNEEALTIYELDRCVECGCCVAGCATVNLRPDFMAAAGILRVARFMVDPRDERTDSQWYDVVGTDEGIFGCMSLMGCQDFCPKHIPLQSRLAMVRRKMAIAGIFKK